MAREYPVGYRKPPKSSQFKKGRSGNPKGRPKGSRNLATDLKAELEGKIVVRESGAQRRLTKQQVLLKTLMARALQGDMKAATAILNMVLRLNLAAQELPIDTGLDDEFVLTRFAPQVLQKLARKLKPKPAKESKS